MSLHDHHPYSSRTTIELEIDFERAFDVMSIADLEGVAEWVKSHIGGRQRRYSCPTSLRTSMLGARGRRPHGFTRSNLDHTSASSSKVASASSTRARWNVWPLISLN